MTKPAMFKSEDGSLRCTACALHADTCTCNPQHPLRQIGLLPEKSDVKAEQDHQ